MQNIKENKRIYLSGGGNEKQSFPLDKFFFDTLPVNGKFLYIPVALRGHELYPTANLWMKGVVELHKRSDVQFEVADDLSKYSLNDLKKYDGVYIGGGNTWNLIQETKSSGFSDILIQYLQNGGQLYGGSAGAIIFGKKIDTQDDENNLGFKDVSGLDVLSGYSVACHFKNDQSDRFKTWATNNNLPVICLSEDSGLIIENGVAVSVGSKPCVIFSASGLQNDLSSQKTFKL